MKKSKLLFAALVTSISFITAGIMYQKNIKLNKQNKELLIENENLLFQRDQCRLLWMISQ